MAIIKGKRGDAETGAGFERGRDTQEELWKIAQLTERRKAVLLPALLHVAIGALIRGAGATTSEDVTTLLSRSAALPLIGVQPKLAMAMTQSAMAIAKSMLDAANPEDEAEAVLVAASLIMRIVDERKFPGGDYENQAILVALMLYTEAREHPEVGWDLREEKLPDMVDKMVDKAALAGIPLL